MFKVMKLEFSTTSKSSISQPLNLNVLKFGSNLSVYSIGLTFLGKICLPELSEVLLILMELSLPILSRMTSNS